MVPQREGAWTQLPPCTRRARTPGQDVQAVTGKTEGGWSGGFSDSQPLIMGAGLGGQDGGGGIIMGLMRDWDFGAWRENGFKGTLGEARRTQAD